jgi:hypothetical protein
LEKLREQFPGGMKSLNTFFDWAKDKDSELAILRSIIQSLHHR